jgi:hypothetical protein
VGQHLFIVARQQPHLYSYLLREFSEEPDVQVIMDRRFGERRRRGDRRTVPRGDRRQGDRRGKLEIDAQLAAIGYAFVRLA